MSYTGAAEKNGTTSKRPSEKEASIQMYTERAAGYDAAGSGWHAVLGRDYVDWIQPSRGAYILDLACGTGLVTIPMAEAVGEEGYVLGVDITRAMLEEARKKTVDEGAARIDWVEGDICHLDEIGEMSRAMKERPEGFDVISCCSAIVLLPDLVETIKHWTKYLRKGGELIVDIPSEERGMTMWFMIDLRKELGVPFHFDDSSAWVKGPESLGKVLEDAGLDVEKVVEDRELWGGHSI